MLKNKTLLKVISIVIAVLLWIYVMGEVDPETTAKVNDIKVTFSNTEVLAESGLAALENEQLTVSAVIEGKRSDVNKAKKKGLTASIDVGSCRKGTNRKTVSLNLPSGVSLDSLSQSTVKVKVEEIVWKEKPVKISFDDAAETDVSSNTAAWITGTDPGKVTVYGAESLVDSVKYLTGSISAELAGIEKSRTNVKLTPVDKSGSKVQGVTLNVKKAVVSTQLLNVTKLPAEIEAAGLDSEYKVSSIECGDIKVAGTEDALENLHSLECTVDLSNADKSGEYTVNVNTENLPEGIYLYDDKDIKAKVTISEAD